MKKIAVITGTRAEYGILYPLLKAIHAKSGLELLLVVTGMHLSHEFGYTAEEIERDGFRIDSRIEMLLSSDTPEAMAKSIGLGIMGMSQAFGQLKPDVVVVLGDRVEPLAATIAGAYMNIPIAHIHGGEFCGNIDDSSRHAITKFAHIHFPATGKSAETIIRMGEEKWRVHVVGAPGLDVVLNENLLPVETLAKKLDFDFSRPLILVVQHPVTSQIDEAAQQMRQTLEAVVELGHSAVIIYPNADAGGRRMIDVIREYEKYPFVRTFKSLPRKEYLSLLKAASVIVGNSSSGIIEAPSFGMPAVNIGIRQAGRERGRNVLDAGHDKEAITEAIKKALTDKKFLAEAAKRQNPYGDGKASQRIVKILSKLEITPQLLQKKSSY